MNTLAETHIPIDNSAGGRGGVNNSGIDSSFTGSSSEVVEMPPFPANLKVTSPIIREWITKRREEIRPWSDFFKTSHFDMPKTPARLSNRVIKNLEHFQSNYVFVFVVLFIYCLITSPLLIIVIAASCVTCFILSAKQQNRKLMIANHEVTLVQQYAVVALISIPIFLIAGAGAAVFWVLGASFFCIILHASFHNFDTLQDGNSGEDGEAVLIGNISEDV